MCLNPKLRQPTPCQNLHARMELSQRQGLQRGWRPRIMQTTEFPHSARIDSYKKSGGDLCGRQHTVRVVCFVRRGGKRASRNGTRIRIKQRGWHPARHGPPEDSLRTCSELAQLWWKTIDPKLGSKSDSVHSSRTAAHTSISKKATQSSSRTSLTTSPSC